MSAMQVHDDQNISISIIITGNLCMLLVVCVSAITLQCTLNYVDSCMLLEQPIYCIVPEHVEQSCMRWADT